MEAALFIYLAALIGKLEGIAIIMCVFMSFIMTALVIYYAGIQNTASWEIQGNITLQDWKDAQVARLTSRVKKTLYYLVACVTLIILVPSERTVYLSAAAYVAQEAVTSEIADELKDILKLKLQEYKKELQKDLQGTVEKVVK